MRKPLAPSARMRAVLMGHFLSRKDHLHLHSPLPCFLIGIADAQIVRGKPQQPGNDSLIGAVALARLGKGAVEGDLSRADLVAQDAAGHIAQPGSPGGVGTGRPDHPGADDIKKLVGTIVLTFLFSKKTANEPGSAAPFAGLHLIQELKAAQWAAFSAGSSSAGAFLGINLMPPFLYRT